MTRIFLLGFFLLTLAAPSMRAVLQPETPPPPASGSSTTDQAAADRTAAAASTVLDEQSPAAPDFLELLVDEVLGLFNIRTSGNSITHYAISAVLLIVALLARRIVTMFLFPLLKRLAGKTKTTLDDKMLPALESPIAAFIMLVGIFAALRVLKLTASADEAVSLGAHVAFSLATFWLLWRGLQAVLDHGAEIAQHRHLGIVPFMPWIKKSLMTVFIVFGVLLTIESLGYNVKAILTGLGIGGLAFALAAQDTLANVFGAIVVAVDQPFKLGEVVRIQGNVGFIEDIGVRSTRIRLIDKSLMVIPNKIVAAEVITNLSRFIRRRFEQVIGLTYDTPIEQMEGMVEEIRCIIKAQPEVDAAGVMVFFRDFSASSLDIWVVYETTDADFQKAMRCKQRVNLEIMRAVETRGLSFAFPTQTLQLDGPVAKQLAEKNAASAADNSGPEDRAKQAPTPPSARSPRTGAS